MIRFAAFVLAGAVAALAIGYWSFQNDAFGGLSVDEGDVRAGTAFAGERLTSRLTVRNHGEQSRRIWVKSQCGGCLAIAGAGGAPLEAVDIPPRGSVELRLELSTKTIGPQTSTVYLAGSPAMSDAIQVGVRWAVLPTAMPRPPCVVLGDLEPGATSSRTIEIVPHTTGDLDEHPRFTPTRVKVSDPVHLDASLTSDGPVQRQNGQKRQTRHGQSLSDIKRR